MTRTRSILTASILAAAIAGPAAAAAGVRGLTAEQDCYDALVWASAVRQTPTPVPECDDGCIVISWPWLVDLDIARVIKGRVQPGRLLVIRLQHSYSHPRRHRWWLRRNSLGAFNVLLGDHRLPRCAPGVAPASPYVSPPKGKTLRDMAREAEARHLKEAR
ncbi:MAG: hypothetical protein V4574_20865 [Pseudomonadota bacterium]